MMISVITEVLTTPQAKPSDSKLPPGFKLVATGRFDKRHLPKKIIFIYYYKMIYLSMSR